MSRTVCFIDDDGMVGTCINFDDEGNCDCCKHNDEVHKKFVEGEHQKEFEKDMVNVTCYKKTTTMTRHDAIQFYLKAMRCSEGSERSRYTNIYLQLLDGNKDCSDEVIYDY